VSGRVDIFDMVDIDLFTIVALNMIVLKLGYTGESEPMFYNHLRPLTSLDVGLYALACEEDVPCLATLVRSFKLIEVYIKHGVTILDSYLRATLEDITDELAATASQIIDDVIRQLSFDETELNREAGFVDVAGVVWTVQVETQSKLPVSEEPDVGPTQEPILAESSEDAVTNDDDDVDEDFFVDEENEIVEPDVDVYLFGINMDLPFANIGITNLVSGDVLEGNDVDVINADGFNSGPGNDEERNYRKRRLAELRNEMECVINASDYVLQYYMLRDYVTELQSTNPNTIVKISVEENTYPSLPSRVFQRIYVCLGALKLGFRVCRRDLLGLDGLFTKGPFLGQVLVAIGLDSNNGIYPLAYALVKAKTKSVWCWFLQCLGDDIDQHHNLNFTFISDRQKDLLWRAASATNVRDFEKCMLELKTMNPKAHKWLNKIPAEHWARSYFSGVIDKCTGPLTPTATRIMQSIKKEAYLMKVQWNGANKYQVSGLLGDQCVMDVAATKVVAKANNKFVDKDIRSQEAINLHHAATTTPTKAKKQKQNVDFLLQSASDDTYGDQRI
nr:hypothetical protein [Tanacetum cinerariifolium]